VPCFVYDDVSCAFGEAKSPALGRKTRTLPYIIQRFGLFYDDVSFRLSAETKLAALHLTLRLGVDEVLHGSAEGGIRAVLFGPEM